MDLKHVKEEVIGDTRISYDTFHYAESAYRRGVQQALVYAENELNRIGCVNASMRIDNMASIAGKMRYQSHPHDFYLDDLMRTLGKGDK